MASIDFISRPLKTKSGKIGLICVAVLLASGIIGFSVYMILGKKKVETPAQITSILPLTSMNSSASSTMTQKFMDASKQTFGTCDDMINAFKDIDIGQVDEGKLTDPKEKKILQALRKMSSSLSNTQLKDILEGKKVEITKQDREALRELVISCSFSDSLRQTLNNNLDNSIVLENTQTTSIIQTPITDKNVGEMKSKLTAEFLQAINTSTFKINFADEKQLERIELFTTVPELDIFKLYEVTNIDNAIEFHKIAVDVMAVWKICKDKDPQSLAHNVDILAKIGRIEPYLTDVDCLRLKAIFKPPLPDPVLNPIDVEKLKTFDPNQAKFSIQNLVNLEKACADATARAANANLESLCGLLTELKTLDSLSRDSSTPSLTQLGHLFTLKKNVGLVLETEMDGVLNEIKNKVPPGDSFKDYLDTTKDPIDNVILLDAAKKLYEIWPYLNTTGADKRITDLKTISLTSPEDLIIRDLTNVMLELYQQANALPPPADKADLEQRLNEFFIQQIKPIGNVPAATVQEYLTGYIVRLQYDSDKNLLVADFINKLSKPGWIYPTDVDTFKTRIEQLMAFQTDNSITDSDIQATADDTLKHWIKLKILPQLLIEIKRLNASTLNSTDGAKWVELFQNLKRILSNVFDEIKSLDSVNDQISFCNLITLWKLNKYQDIVRRDFTTTPLDLTLDNTELINTLKTVRANPQLKDLLKLDIPVASWATLEGILINISDIEVTHSIIRSGSATFKMSQYKTINKTKNVPGLAPITIKLRDKIKPFVLAFLSSLIVFNKNHTNAAEKGRCEQAANDLILFESRDCIEDYYSLASFKIFNITERQVVDNLLYRKYRTGLDFIRGFLEEALTQSNKANWELWYQTLYVFVGTSIPVFIPDTSWDILNFSKYEKAKEDNLEIIWKAIEKSLESLDSSQLSDDIFKDLCDSSKPDSLAKLRNDIFYLYDPVEPEFEQNESAESMKAKILNHFHGKLMTNLYRPKINFENESYADSGDLTKKACEYIDKYLKLCPTFTSTLPEIVKNISNGSTLKAYMEQAEKKDQRLHNCIATASKNQVRSAIFDSPPLSRDIAISALNECIRQMQVFGEVSLPTGKVYFAKTEVEKDNLLVHAIEDYVKAGELKLIAQRLVNHSGGTSPELLTELKKGQEVFDKIKDFSNVMYFEKLEDLQIACHPYVWSIIGNEAASNFVSKAEIDASLVKINRFLQTPGLQRTQPQIYLLAELASGILSEFLTSFEDSNIPADSRAKPTFSQALQVAGVNPNNVEAFWKCRLSIWYLANIGFESLMDLVNNSTSHFGIVSHELYIELELIKDFEYNDGRNPFQLHNLDDLKAELTKDETINLIKHALLQLDPYTEFRSITNANPKLDVLRVNAIAANRKSPSFFTVEFYNFAFECIRSGNGDAFLRYEDREKAIGRSSICHNHLIMAKRGIELEIESQDKLKEMDTNLPTGSEVIELFKCIYFATQTPNLLAVANLKAFANATAVKRKEFLDTFTKFLGTFVKLHILNSDDLNPSKILVLHQKALIDLKRIELHQATEAGKYQLTANYATCFDPTKGQAEDTYLKYLKLAEAVYDYNLPEYNGAFDCSEHIMSKARQDFIQCPSLNNFAAVVDDRSVTSAIITGLERYVANRKELFGPNYINDPLQNAINLMMDSCIAFIKVKLDMLQNPKYNNVTINRSDPVRTVPLDSMINNIFVACVNNNDILDLAKYSNPSVTWYGDFLTQLMDAGRKNQASFDYYNALLVEIDKLEPVFDAKVAGDKKVTNGPFHHWVLRLYVLSNLPITTSYVAIGATDQTRLDHCFGFALADYIRTVIGKKDQPYFEGLFEILKKNGQLPHTTEQKATVNQYVQWNRLTRLIDDINTSDVSIIIKTSTPGPDGKRKLEFGNLQPELADEILKMPIFQDPELMDRFATCFNDSDDVKARRAKLFEFVLLHSLLFRDDSLLEEVAITKIWEIWRTQLPAS